MKKKYPLFRNSSNWFCISIWSSSHSSKKSWGCKKILVLALNMCEKVVPSFLLHRVWNAQQNLSCPCSSKYSKMLFLRIFFASDINPSKSVNPVIVMMNWNISQMTAFTKVSSNPSLLFTLYPYLLFNWLFYMCFPLLTF